MSFTTRWTHTQRLSLSKSSPTKRKCALTFDDLKKVTNDLESSIQHNDLLFLSMLITGFFTLMYLGKLSFLNNQKLRSWKKISKRSSVILSDDHYGFHLPCHKANWFFEGNHIIVKSKQYCDINPLMIFTKYLTSHDCLFPLSSPLWLMKNRAIPNCQFFISHLRHYFTKDIAGQSMCARGATSLAEHGVPPSLIQFMGRWSSDAFFIYIRKSPVLIQALLHSNQHH